MKMTSCKVLAGALLAACTVGSAVAAPITFPFRFDDPASTAEAVGSITFEDTLLVNPGANDFFLPNPAVLALNVTVSGSANGNGSFTINDFDEVVFDTFGGTLNFGSQLVGQPTSGGPWGTPDGNSGDFNLFASQPKGAARYSEPPSAPTGANNPPNGVFFFTLGANGGADEPMVLTAMGANGAPLAPAAALPISRGVLFLMAGLLGFGAIFALRRRNRQV